MGVKLLILRNAGSSILLAGIRSSASPLSPNLCRPSTRGGSSFSLTGSEMFMAIGGVITEEAEEPVFIWLFEVFTCFVVFCVVFEVGFVVFWGCGWTGRTDGIWGWTG